MTFTSQRLQLLAQLRCKKASCIFGYDLRVQLSVLLSHCDLFTCNSHAVRDVTHFVNAYLIFDNMLADDMVADNMVADNMVALS